MKKLAIFVVALMSLSGARASMLDVYIGLTGSMGESVAYFPSSAGGKSTQGMGGLGAVFGFDVPVFRIEGEYNYMLARDLRLSAGLLNVYVKPLPIPLIKPYVGLGAGTILSGTVNDENAKGSPAFQGMLGFQIDVPVTSLFVDLEGRLFYASEIYEIANRSVGFVQYDWRVKLRYAF